MGAEPASPASMRPTLRMARLFLLALGPGGTALAAVAAAVGIACSILVGITLNESLTASQFSQELNYQQRVLAFSRTDRQLMHAIEGLSSGYLVPRPGDFPVRARWRAFDGALAEICGALDPAIPNIDRLRQTCLDRDSFRAVVEPELLAFNPPTRPLTRAVLQRLQELRSDISHNGKKQRCSRTAWSRSLDRAALPYFCSTATCFWSWATTCFASWAPAP